MPLIDDAELQALRADLEEALPDRCTVKRQTRATDTTTGAWTEGTTDVAVDVPCRVDLGGRSPTERVQAGTLAAQADYAVMLSAHADRWPGGVVDVKATDVLVVTGSAAGTYLPVAAGGPTTEELTRVVPANKAE